MAEDMKEKIEKFDGKNFHQSEDVDGGLLVSKGSIFATNKRKAKEDDK